MKHFPKLSSLIAIGLVFTQTIAFTQTDAALLRDLAEENRKTVEALALYPSVTRLAILEATKHPEVLIKMQSIRERTSAAFRTLIEDFPQSTQLVFYDLSRYPGLTESLVAQQNDPSAIRKSLEVLPEEERESFYGVVTRQMPTVRKIKELDQTTQAAFDQLGATYSPQARAAFEHLLGLPEVIDLLNEDLRFTILVGETYQENPAWVIHNMDSLNLAVARTHAKELEDWKTTLENDPVAKAELQEAANEYATENGYLTDDYSGDDLYYEGEYYEREAPRFAQHHYNPYPYWYGYPYWEPYPRWRPYPWWWDLGGYYRPQGFVVVYLPSYHFMDWYFYHPHHHYRYNHLSTHFVNHYYGHRNSGTTITMGVRDWQNRNRNVISNDFLADKTRLPDRLKEYGRFETSRQEFNAKNPRKALTQTEYLDKNARKFPEVKRSKETAQAEIQRDNQATREKRSDWAPQKATSRPEPDPAPRPQRPSRTVPTPAQKQPRTEQPVRQEPTRTDQPATREPARQPRTQPEEAKDYHRQKWEEQRPATRPTPQMRPSTSPAPRTAPAKRIQPPTKNIPKGRGN